MRDPHTKLKIQNRFLPMTAYAQLQSRLLTERHTWLVTGVAGFIGSNLLETLLKLNQCVVGLDNFATGHQRNLDEVQSLVTPAQWANFRFIQGDIRNVDDCHNASKGVDYILHQAALGSVPRSVADPIATNATNVTNVTNVTGFLNMLVAARDAKVKRFVYAASSSTYGDHPALPKVEENIGKPLSPYAVTKYVNELYADVFGKAYGLQSIGLSNGMETLAEQLAIGISIFAPQTAYPTRNTANDCVEAVAVTACFDWRKNTLETMKKANRQRLAFQG